MQMNKDIAKLIGAVDYHKVVKSMKGTKYLKVPNMVSFIWDGVEPKFWPRGVYYLPISLGSRLGNIVEQTDVTQQDMDMAQQKFIEAEKAHKDNLKVLNDLVTENVRETLVVWIYTKNRKEKLECSPFWEGLISHNDKLERLGIRSVGREMCIYVALITIRGIYEPKRLDYIEYGLVRQVFNAGSAEHVGEIKRLNETTFSLDKDMFEAKMEVPLL